VSLKVRTYLATLLSLALLAGAVVAPACAHGATCPYMTQRGWVGATAPMSSAHTMQHTSGCAFAMPHAGQSGVTKLASNVPGDQTTTKSCCSKGDTSHMRLADDRANLTQVPSVAIAPAQTAVVPQQASALLPPLPAALAPPQRALSSTIIRI